ncbi:MAG: SPOR domain-containing protein [Candidatus Neomarinimicrobiota bacterium]|jgi:cell division septation protein DedD
MMKKNIKTIILLSAIIFLGNLASLKAVDILKILEGYGRDSIATFSAGDAQSEAADVFNLLLESDGEITVKKAEDQLNKSKSLVMKSYLALMLADYAYVNNDFENGKRYLKRALDEYDPIRNDSYYRLVFARAEKAILESSGKNEEGKRSVLQDYSPEVSTKEITVKKINAKAARGSEITTSKPENSTPLVEFKSDVNNDNNSLARSQVSSQVNYRMQIGAFGVRENAQRKKEFYEKEGYPVHIETRGTSNKPLYIVQLGAFETYQETKSALSRFKAKYSGEDGIVIKVNR